MKFFEDFWKKQKTFKFGMPLLKLIEHPTKHLVKKFIKHIHRDK